MHMKKKLILSALFSSLALSACQQQPAEKTQAATNAATEKTSAATGDVLATVNGKVITMEDFRKFIQQKKASNPGDTTEPAMLLNEMVNREILLQTARKEGIDKLPEVREQIDYSTANILVNALVNEKVKQLDLSDAALKAEYDEQVRNMSLKEYKARHILVNSEEEAKAIIKELESGKDFAALAKEKSTGPSGPQGGDLGWFQVQTMVPEFADAVKAMKKGEISKTPVKTQFGWHIIKLEDTRDVEAPGFEESKTQLKSIVTNKFVQNYMKELRDKAKIEVKQPEEKTTGATGGNASDNTAEKSPEKTE